MKFILIFLLSALFPTHAISGPDETTNRFINNSPSLLDFGIYKLDTYLSGSPKLRKLGLITVFFDWEDNTITVQSWTLIPFNSKKAVVEACTDWFEEMRWQAGINSVSGEFLSSKQTISTFAEFFSHEGYMRTIAGKSDDDALVELDKKFRLAYHGVIDASVAPTERTITCNGKLLSKGISVTAE